jgi:hypothetical protein
MVDIAQRHTESRSHSHSTRLFALQLVHHVPATFDPGQRVQVNRRLLENLPHAPRQSLEGLDFANERIVVARFEETCRDRFGQQNTPVFPHFPKRNPHFFEYPLRQKFALAFGLIPTGESPE